MISIPDALLILQMALVTAKDEETRQRIREAIAFLEAPYWEAGT